jgi:hypothetical protein
LELNQLQKFDVKGSMSHTSPESSLPAFRSTLERQLLEKFRGVNGGFQVPSRSSYRRHEQWRNDVFRGLKSLEAEGLLKVQQLVPCRRHGKCCGLPVAAGCELTPKGQRVRGFWSGPRLPQ